MRGVIGVAVVMEFEGEGRGAGTAGGAVEDERVGGWEELE